MKTLLIGLLILGSSFSFADVADDMVRLSRLGQQADLKSEIKRLIEKKEDAQYKFKKWCNKDQEIKLVARSQIALAGVIGPIYTGIMGAYETIVMDYNYLKGVLGDKNVEFSEDPYAETKKNYEGLEEVYEELFNYGPSKYCSVLKDRVNTVSTEEFELELLKKRYQLAAVEKAIYSDEISKFQSSDFSAEDELSKKTKAVKM